MSLSTYADLKTAVGLWLNRSDLSGYIPDLVRLGEQRIYFGADQPFPSQPLRIPALQAQATGTISSGTIAFPSRFLEPIKLAVSYGGTSWNLEYVTPSQFTELANNSDPPSVYTYYNNAIYTAGTASASYTLDYYQSLALLSSDSDTNWILTNTPGVYLYAALLEAEPFLKNDGRLSLWHSMFKSSISAVNRSATYQGPLRVRAG